MDVNERKQIVRDLNSAEQHLWDIWDINNKMKQGDQQLERYKRAAYENSGSVAKPSQKELDEIRESAYQREMVTVERQKPAAKHSGEYVRGYLIKPLFIGVGLGVMLSLSIGSSLVNSIQRKANMTDGQANIILLILCVLVAIIAGIVAIRGFRYQYEDRMESYLRAERAAKEKAEEAVNEHLRDYNQANAVREKKMREYKDYEKQWATERKALEESIRSRKAAAKQILDAYDIPDVFRSHNCVSELASMFDQQVVSTFQEAYGRLREEQKANDRFHVDQMNRQFQWEMEQDAQRERDRKLEEERRWQRDIDRMHRENLETAARDLAYEERRKADALEDIKKKLED